MTVRTESRITVAGSVGDVWAYLCDVERWAEWAPTVLECRIRGGGPLQAGGWVEQRARDLGWNHRRRERVTAVDPPHSVSLARAAQVVADDRRSDGRIERLRAAETWNRDATGQKRFGFQ